MIPCVQSAFEVVCNELFVFSDVQELGSDVIVADEDIGTMQLVSLTFIICLSFELLMVSMAFCSIVRILSHIIITGLVPVESRADYSN